MFNHKQMIIDSFKYCALTVATDSSEDLLIHCPKAQLMCSRSRSAKGVILRCSSRERRFFLDF